MSNADIWTDVDDMLPKPDSDVVMVWAGPNERALKQGKFFGPDSGLHGFATLAANGKHYVGKIFVTHWAYVGDLLPEVSHG